MRGTVVVVLAAMATLAGCSPVSLARRDALPSEGNSHLVMRTKSEMIGRRNARENIGDDEEDEDKDEDDEPFEQTNNDNDHDHEEEEEEEHLKQFEQSQKIHRTNQAQQQTCINSVCSQGNAN